MRRPQRHLWFSVVLLLGLLVSACGPRGGAAPSEVQITAPAPEVAHEVAAKDDDRRLRDADEFWAGAAEIPDRLAWLEEEVWLADPTTRRRDPLQRYRYLRWHPHHTQLVEQVKRASLRIQARGREATLINLEPGIVSCVEILHTLDDTPSTRDSVSHVLVCCVIDAKARRSRVVMIPGTENNFVLPDRMSTLLACEGAAFTGVTYDRRRHRLFILDAAGFRVWRVDDSDGDGIPDLVSRGSVVAPDTYVLAKYTSPPLSIAWFERPGLAGLVPSSSALDGRLGPGDLRDQKEDIVIWADTNDDGYMDLRTVWTPRAKTNSKR